MYFKKILNFRIYFLLVVTNLLPLGTFAGDVGRIQDPTDAQNVIAAQTRCGGIPLPEATCIQARAAAVASNCITQAESNQLASWGLAPVCFFDNTYHGWCTCGCFHPDTEIDVQVASGPKITASAQTIFNDRNEYLISHLKTNSELNLLQFDAASTLYATSGLEKLPLVVIKTEDGAILKVTTQHAVLTGDGEMLQAQHLKENMLLVKRDGSLTAIKQISSEMLGGNVLNFRLKVDNPIEHIIVAQGLLVGDQAWQSSLEDLENQVLIRKE